MNGQNESMLRTHFLARSTFAPNPIAHAVFVALVALLVALVDLLLGMGYWMLQGVTPWQVLNAIAAWVLGPHPPMTGLVLAIGLTLHYLMYLIMVTGFDRLLAIRRTPLTHWAIAGAAFGVTAYVVLFQLVVPTMVFPLQIARSPEWVTTCVVAHATVLGPLMAFLLKQEGSSPKA